MKLKELLAVTNARNIQVATPDHEKYFSLDNGQTFQKSLFKSDDNLTDILHNMTVNYFTPIREDFIEVVVKE